MPGRIIPFADLHSHVGRHLGSSDWTVIEQVQTAAFAALTGDDEWIHVDVARATREIGGTIIHGYHLLSLIPHLSQQIFQIDGASHGLNYGIDRLRFTDPVRPGDNLRLHQTLLSVSERGEGLMVTIGARVEIKGEDRPAMVANYLFLLFPVAPGNTASDPNTRDR